MSKIWKGGCRTGGVDGSPTLQWFWTEDWEGGTHIWWVEATEATKHPAVREPVPNCPNPSSCILRSRNPILCQYLKN